ncbi:hypothetical protein AGLY_014991 [Aphis glycines]|uniref:Uncharacterized protein n=1 Tax=Aphis glycines TaxID=307491 RepID=A0A6G0T4V3_APHGL|nr:hypothetical protein AGLY_014991 [Aphis glycines]
MYALAATIGHAVKIKSMNSKLKINLNNLLSRYRRREWRSHRVALQMILLRVLVSLLSNYEQRMTNVIINVKNVSYKFKKECGQVGTALQTLGAVWITNFRRCFTTTTPTTTIAIVSFVLVKTIYREKFKRPNLANCVNTILCHGSRLNSKPTKGLWYLHNGDILASMMIILLTVEYKPHYNHCDVSKRSQQFYYRNLECTKIPLTLIFATVKVREGWIANKIWTLLVVCVGHLLTAVTTVKLNTYTALIKMTIWNFRYLASSSSFFASFPII